VTLTLSRDRLQAISTHAERTYPEECCGLLLGRLETKGKVVHDIQATENAWNSGISEDLVDDSLPLTKTHRYWIAPEEMLTAMREARGRGLEIIGVYHSHTDNPAVPSECDRRLAWPQYSYLIVSVRQGNAVDAKSWTLDDHHQFQSESMNVTDMMRMCDR